MKTEVIIVGSVPSVKDNALGACQVAVHPGQLISGLLGKQSMLSGIIYFSLVKRSLPMTIPNTFSACAAEPNTVPAGTAYTTGGEQPPAAAAPPPSNPAAASKAMDPEAPVDRHTDIMTMSVRLDPLAVQDALCSPPQP